MKTKDLRQEVEFNASAHEVYEMLMDSRKHAEITGGKASISREIGGKSTAFGDWLMAINIELVPNKKIVQKWRGADWPDGHFSLAIFEIEDDRNGSKLVFTQTGIPYDKYDDISDGWKDHYWEKMKKIFKKLLDTSPVSPTR